MGLSKHQVVGMVHHGLLRRHRRGVYASTVAPADHRQAAMLAILSAPDGAVVSHDSALFVHGHGRAPAQVHITVDPRHRVRLPGVVVHRSPMPPPHRATIGRMPVTSLSRTIVDLAAVTDLETLTAAMDPLISDGRIHPSRLLSTLDDIVAAPGRHGTTLLRTALDAWMGPIELGSPAEARLLRLLRERRYGGYEAQVRLEVDDREYFVDVGWRDRCVGLEYAGRVPHGPRRWGRDERRADDLERIGWAIREVDATSILPGHTELWDWLEAHLRRGAA